jgi:membrane dipeptidase
LTFNDQFADIGIISGRKRQPVRYYCQSKQSVHRDPGGAENVVSPRAFPVSLPNSDSVVVSLCRSVRPEFDRSPATSSIHGGVELKRSGATTMLAIFDGHNDTVQRLREYRPDGIDFLARSTNGHLDLPRALDGGLVGGLFAMFVRAERPSANNLIVTSSGHEVRLAEPLDTTYARRKTQEQLTALKRLEARAEGRIRIATSLNELHSARQARAFAVVLHMEGADGIDADLSDLERLYGSGLRSLGLVWSRPNIFGHGVPFAWPCSPDTGPGLTPAGKDLVRACNRLGVMIDVSHLNEKGFWDVARLSTAPLVATHACAHAICSSTRNLTDRQLDAIRESDGVVGVNFSVNDVRPDAQNNADTPLDLLVRHFHYLVERIGIDRVAIGSDFDGAKIPAAIKDASGLPNLIAALRASGLDEDSIQKIAFDNWMRAFRLTWRR